MIGWLPIALPELLGSCDGVVREDGVKGVGAGRTLESRICTICLWG